MKTMMKAILMTLVALSFALTGCDTPDPQKSTGTATKPIKASDDTDDDNCDDGNSCTDDFVNPAKGFICDSTSIAGCCNEEVACPNGLTCDLNTNSCVGCLLDEDCDDSVDCTTDSCVDNTCEITADNTLCDDGAFCTGIETCDVALGCVDGTDPVVDDGIDCTVDTCDEDADMILNTADNTLCDDSNPCSTDVCDSLAGCSNESIEGCCTTDQNCFDFAETAWGYSSPCTIDADCVEPGYACIEGVMCLPAAYDFGCTTDIDGVGNIDNLPGTCEMCADTNQDGECSKFETFCEGGFDEDQDSLIDCEDDDCDGQPCGGGLICEDGACVDDAECEFDIDCEDGNVCTTDTCVDSACVQVFNNNPCDDGDACTADDECKDGGVCMGGPELDCDDGDECTTDSCDPVDGCVHESIPGCGDPCDGIECQQGQHCEVGECVPDAFAIWCWDDKEPGQEPSCHLHSTPIWTYSSPVTWLWSDFPTVPPTCDASDQAPVFYPDPICCVGPDVLYDGWPCYGNMFNPYQ